MKWLAPLLLGGLLSSPALAQDQRSIPGPFRGDWSLRAANCAPGPVDGGNIRIGRRTIWTFETRTDVRRVRIIAPNSIEYSGRGHNGGPTYGDHSRLTLLDSGARLAIGDGEDREFYVRCAR